MANTTNNYNLNKPLENEKVNISVINQNMDIIDINLKSLSDKINDVKLDIPSTDGLVTQITFNSTLTNYAKKTELPEEYDDTALVNRIKKIESDYLTSSDKTVLTSAINEAKQESVNMIPTKTSQLTNDSGFKTTDNNTTYKLSKSGSSIILTGSDGSSTSVTDSDINTVTTVTTVGSGNAITSLSANNGVITATKENTFLTSHPTVSKITDTTSATTVDNSGTFTVVDSITMDDNGHVTKINTKTVTLSVTGSSGGGINIYYQADEPNVSETSVWIS